MKGRFLYSLAAWLIAMGLYGSLVRMYSPAEHSPMVSGSWSLFFKTWLFSALILSVSDYLANRVQCLPPLQHQPIWLMILGRTLGLLLALLLVMYTVSLTSFNDPTLDFTHFTIRVLSRPNELFLLLLYCSLCSVMIGLIKHSAQCMGANVLCNLLFGKYREPRVEDKMIMFVDLRDSMGHAEEMGTREFAHLLQDFFVDLNQVAARFDVEIHKYIGDEAILVWSAENDELNQCLPLYFALQDKIHLRERYYQNRYGMLPEFKAGLNFGHITVTEIGEQKREIAYLSEAMHTTARLQNACTRLGEPLLVSREARDKLSGTGYQFKALGKVDLKGKRQGVEVYGVRRRPPAEDTTGA